MYNIDYYESGQFEQILHSLVNCQWTKQQINKVFIMEEQRTDFEIW